MSGLAVTSLVLSRFRSHGRARLALDGRPVAIFGPNGAGKTNILEAISLLSPGRGLRRSSAEDMAQKPAPSGWKITAEVTGAGQGHELATWWQGGAGRSVEIDGKASPQLALGRLMQVVWLVPAMDRLWTESAEGRRRFLDRLVLSFAPGHGEAVLAYDKAMRQRNRLLKDMVRDSRWYDALEARMGESGAQIQAGRRAALDRIVAAQEGAETSFPAADLALSGPDENPQPETEADLKSALAASRRADMTAGRTLVGPHRTDLHARYAAKGMPAAEASTGEQKALLLSLILSNARALAQDTGHAPILLLDEVAAHLDAGRRAALYDEICALGAQAWMSGTGAELFDALGARAQRLEVTEADGVSQIIERQSG